MNSKTSICNLALAYLGQPPISSLQQDNAQARWLALFYEPVREEVLRAHDWAFATADRALIPAALDIQAGGERIYQYPADALFIRKVYAAGDPSKTPQPFHQRFEANLHTRVLVAPISQARVRYTRRITDETLYDACFVKCFALALACDCALALTGDVEVAARVQQQYTLYLEEARRANMTELLERAPQADGFSEVR